MDTIDIAGYVLNHPGEAEIYEALRKFHKIPKDRDLGPEQMRELRGLFEHINEQSQKGANPKDLERTRKALAANVLSLGTVRWEKMRKDAATFASMHRSSREAGERSYHTPKYLRP